MTNTPTLAEVVASMGEVDQANFTTAVAAVASSFSSTTGVEVDPAVVASLPAIRDHVLSGGEYALNLEEAMKQLADVPSVSNTLVARRVKAAEHAKIQADIAHMRPDQRMTYARQRGLDSPRPDVADSMTENERNALLAQLPPAARIAEARRRGWI